MSILILKPFPLRYSVPIIDGFYDIQGEFSSQGFKQRMLHSTPLTLIELVIVADYYYYY